MEDGKGVVEKKGIKEVVVNILGADEVSGVTRESKDSKSFPSSSLSNLNDSNLDVKEAENRRSGAQMSGKSSPNSSKPPINPNATMIRRVSIARSAFWKPKSRLVEPPCPIGVNLAEEKTPLMTSSSPKVVVASSSNKVTLSTPKGDAKSDLNTAKMPLVGSGGDEEDDEEVYRTANLKLSENSSKKLKMMVLVEWIAFVCITGCLIASLVIERLQNHEIWGLELWKWCVLVLVIFCGRLFTEWFINVVTFLIERNFVLKKKVLYFVYGLKSSVQAFTCLGLVLIAWVLLINRGVERSKSTTKVLNYVTRALASCLIGAAIWLLKTLLIKILASSFQCTRFFDRIQVSIFHQYVVQTLSGPPVMEMAERVGSSSTGQLSLRTEKTKGKEDVIDVEKLKKMNQEKISAWTMKGLINVIRGSRLATISNTLEEYNDDESEQKNEEITSAWEAKAAAYRVFRNVAKPGHKYIDEEDLLRFMKKEEVDNVFALFEGSAETRKIKRKSLKNWLVNVYLERKSLAHSLNDTKTAIEELNKLVSGILLVVILIVWLIIMDILTTQMLVFISSQLLLVAFIFGNTAKTVFEAIIFVFVMHPYDVGDRCVIEGIQMVVEEVNILTTVFLRYDNEKIFYPNTVLATKPISNFYRSPEMSDSVEFSVDVSTSIETIGALKARIKMYLESKPLYWRPSHSVQVKEIENVNKMKMALYVNHTINFQDYADKSNRRSELVLELKKYFEDLGIKYHLLPQEVQLSNIGTASPAATLTGTAW